MKGEATVMKREATVMKREAAVMKREAAVILGEAALKKREAALIWAQSRPINPSNRTMSNPITPDPTKTTPATPEPAAPEPAAKKTRAKPGIIDQDIKNSLDLAERATREAAKPEIASKLLERAWGPADQAAVTASLALCNGYVNRIKAGRTGKSGRTSAETLARQELLHGLDPILKGARRSHPEGSAERAAYGIGEAVSGQSTPDLLALVRYAASQLVAPEGGVAKDVLKGVLPTEIAALTTLEKNYKNADWAQADAQKSVAELLALLVEEVTTKLRPALRDLQGAADQAYTHRDPVNGPQRKAFGLQPNRPLMD